MDGAANSCWVERVTKLDFSYFFISFSLKLSKIFSWAIILFPEMQTCPAFSILERAHSFTAWSRSASSQTMKGSEPPSSITHFLRCCEAVVATLLPPFVLPVKLTPLTLRSEMIAAEL